MQLKRICSLKSPLCIEIFKICKVNLRTVKGGRLQKDKKNRERYRLFTI